MSRSLHLAVAALVLYAAACLLPGGARPCAADDPELLTRAHDLVRRLDDDSFSVRETAYRELLEIGLAALPALQQVANSRSVEQRQRARALLSEIQRRVLRESFLALARKSDEEFDLELGMTLVSRMIDPLARHNDLTKQLDELANRVRLRLGKDVNPRAADPRKVVDAVREALFTDVGFIGNREDYANPRNSSLSHVLATRKGLPILLSQVVVSVGKRLKVPLVGIGLPGRYVVKYDGSQAPEGFPRTDIVFDPFGGGTVLGNDELAMMFPGFNPVEDLLPYGERETLKRILRNLIEHFGKGGQSDQARLAEEFLHLLETYEKEAPLP